MSVISQLNLYFELYKYCGLYFKKNSDTVFAQQGLCLGSFWYVNLFHIFDSILCDCSIWRRVYIQLQPKIATNK